jgi:hypothetical protein
MINLFFKDFLDFLALVFLALPPFNSSAFNRSKVAKVSGLNSRGRTDTANG